jgi:lipopolysaccharide/colanic/teichoic acid biosynthesis glycosyltransferase
MDLALAAGALVVLSPSLAYLGLRVKRSSAGPVLYRHQRLGYGGRPFRVVKFRTMYLDSCRGEDYGGDTAEQHFQTLLTDAANSETFEKAFKFESDPRVTRFGEFLRKTSLDELPQLVNVIKGEMSLVGPRPITAEELPFYGTSARDVLSVRPGLTGYWQVNGRSDADYPERVRLDSTYVKHWSLKLDCTIIGRTFRLLLADRGAR